MQELQHAIEARADIIMLDNFPMDQIKAAVKYNNQKCKLEVSGNISMDNIKEIAETGVDLISSGTITKNCVAIDLSLLIALSTMASKENKKKWQTYKRLLTFTRTAWWALALSIIGYIIYATASTGLVEITEYMINLVAEQQTHLAYQVCHSDSGSYLFTRSGGHF